MLYNPPSGSTDPNAPYIPKNVAAGTQGSKVPPAAVEYTQREIVAAIVASGQTPTNTVLVQAAMALGRGIWASNLSGSGDLAVATLGLVLPSFIQGMRIGAVATAANTTTSPRLRVANLGAAGATQDFPILKADGSALAVGDIKPGRIYRFEADGAGNVLISGGGLGAGFTNESTLLNKTAKQQFSAASTEMDIVWDASTGNPSWATLDASGKFFTVSQKCRVLSFLRVVAAVSCSAAGYAEADAHVAVNGNDIDGTGQSAWPNANTTYLPYIGFTTQLDLNPSDTIRARAVANSANFNGAYVLGTDGAYGISSQSTNWRLLCVSKG